MSSIAAVAGLPAPIVLSNSSSYAPGRGHAAAYSPWCERLGGGFRGCRLRVRRVAASAPERLSEKVAESIKQAEEACSGDPRSGECVAAWDEVEELSAAASHARDRLKVSDPLEAHCADSPETDECRTYED